MRFPLPSPTPKHQSPADHSHKGSTNETDPSIASSRTNARDEMPARQTLGTEFPGGEQRYRSARLRCALACQRYNSQREDISAEERSRLFLDIINCNRIPEFLGIEASASSTAAPPHARGQSSAPWTKTTAKTNGHTVAKKSCELPNAAAASAKSSHSPAEAGHAASPMADGAAPSSLPGTGGSPSGAAARPGVAFDASTTTSSSSSSSSSPSLNGTVNGSSSSPGASAKSAIAAGGQRFPGQGLAPYVKAPLYIDYGARLEIGTSTFINRNCTILDNPVTPVTIGERCMIGPSFSIYALGHPIDSRLRHGPSGAPSYAMGVSIGDDCWIGGNVTVLGGVKIGNGCTVGAGSLVTRDIPAHHLAFGVPARVIRRVSPSKPRSPLGECGFEQAWDMPEWIDSLTYRRLVRIGGHDFVAIEMVVAALAALVSGMLVKMVFFG